jgi:hypothetical protein
MGHRTVGTVDGRGQGDLRSYTVMRSEGRQTCRKSTIVLTAPFKRELGHCWTLMLSNLPQAEMLADLADGPSASSRSPAWLHEDGVPLGPAHALHTAIRDTGAGLFSHWQDTLYFSTSDGSDPNHNGRRYEIVLSPDADPRQEEYPDLPQLPAQSTEIVLGPDAGPRQEEHPGLPELPAQSTLLGEFYVVHNLALQCARIGGPDGALLKKRLFELERRIVQASRRFDDAFYRRSYGALFADGVASVDHFLTVGHEQGLLASARFDPVVYKIFHPVRRHVNPLIDSILKGDDSDYRDASFLLRDLGVDTMPMTRRYAPEMPAAWRENAAVIARNRDRSIVLPSSGGDFEFCNPSPEIVLSRFADNKPFCFARLPHGFWDDWAACRRLAEQLSRHPDCQSLSSREIFNLSVRFLSGLRMSRDHQCYESFFSEIEEDLSTNPRDGDFWTAVSLKGVPTFDDAHLGFDADDVKDRIDLLARFVHPSDVLYDAMLWKRWALTGDLARLSEVVRDHPVVVVGPPQFRSLGVKWRLPDFTHVEIPIDLSHLIRQRMLETLGRVLVALPPAANGRKPVVLFQCSGELSYWIMRRLRRRHADVFFVDLGQALDLWHWQPDAVWMQIYGNAIRAEKPSVETAPEQAPLAPGTRSVVVATHEEVTELLRSDYLHGGPAPAAQPTLTLAGHFGPQGGTIGWSAALPAEMAPLTDHDKAPRHSPLLLLEDGNILGTGHDRHVEIFTLGQGRYSFWKGLLYFSASDNSDPNTNGRRYEVAGWIEFQRHGRRRTKGLMSASLQKQAQRAKGGMPYEVVQLKERLATRAVHEAYAKFNDLMGIREPDELIRGRAASLYDAARSKAKFYLEVEKGGLSYENRTTKVIGEGNHRTLTGRTRTDYIACFENAEVWSLSSCVMHDDDLLFDFEEWEFPQTDDRLELDARVFLSNGRDIWYSKRDPTKAALNIDRAFTLIGCHTREFGHWMTEYLPKYLGALNAGVLPPMPVLIDTGMPPQHRQALEMFVPPGTEIIEVPLQEMVQVRELWCAATPTYSALHERVNEKWRWDLYCCPPWRFKKVIERMTRVLDGMQPTMGAKRVFLARPGIWHRRLVNSAAIETIAHKRGFEIVHPETLSFAEQATLLRSASFVVGPDGSALFLTFLSRPGTKVAILSHPDIEGITSVTAVADELGIETVILTGPVHEKDEAYSQFSSYTIDEDKFRSFLEGWLNEPEERNDLLDR